MARHAQPRAVSGRPVKTIEGVTPGGTDHRLLLALRAPGGLTSDQVCARFGGHQSAALGRLKNHGLINTPRPGDKGKPISLTERGRTLTDPAGPLCRARTLITYCQL